MVAHYSCTERIQISILNKYECQVSNINTYIHIDTCIHYLAIENWVNLLKNVTALLIYWAFIRNF